MKESVKPFQEGVNPEEMAALIAQAEKLSKPEHFEVPTPDPEQVARVQREKAQAKLEEDFAIGEVRKELQATSTPIEHKAYGLDQRSPELNTTIPETKPQPKPQKKSFLSRIFGR